MSNSFDPITLRLCEELKDQILFDYTPEGKSCNPSYGGSKSNRDTFSLLSGSQEEKQKLGEE